MGDQYNRIGVKEHITFGSIVNPGLLWACYPPGVNEEASIQKYQIDTDLEKHFSQRQNRRPAFGEELQYHTRVAVEDPEIKETWMRGMIVGRKLNGRGGVYDVFLVDVGDIFHDLAADNIYLLPEKLAEIPTQAFLIALYGIEPLDVEVDLAAGQTVLVPSLVWNESQLRFINNLVTEAEVALFETKKVVNNVRHGTLFVDINLENWNVNEKLVELQLAFERNSIVDIGKYLVRNSHYDFVKQILGSSPKKRNSSLREVTPSR